MYLLISRIHDKTYITSHESFFALRDEFRLLERDYNIRLKLINESDIFDEECCLDSYPHGTALVVEPKLGITRSSLAEPQTMMQAMDEEIILSLETLMINKEIIKKETYVSPFTGQTV